MLTCGSAGLHLRQCLEGIAHQVQDHLLNLHAVAFDSVVARL